MNEDEGRMTDEQAEYLIAAEAAINAGKATVNELADAEEAGEQITLRELMERLGDKEAAELLTPERKEQIKEAHDQLQKRWADITKSPAMEEIKAQIAALQKRMEELEPFYHDILAAYDEDAPLWEHPIFVVTSAIDIFVHEHQLEGVQDREAYRKPFLTFFEAFLKEWQRIGPDFTTFEDEIARVWSSLRDRGIIQKPIETPLPAQEEDLLLAKNLGEYSKILQRPGLLSLANLNRRRATITLDNLTKQAKATGKGLTIVDEAKLAGKEKDEEIVAAFEARLKKMTNLTAQKLLAIYSMQQAKTRPYGKPDTLFELQVETYMDLCGIPNTSASFKKTQHELGEVAKAWYDASFEIDEKGAEVPPAMRLLQSRKVGGGMVILRFTEMFAAYISKAYIGYYHPSLLKTDERNPNAYFMGQKLLAHYSILDNHTRGTSDFISVKALTKELEAKGTLPTEEEVAKGRQYKQRIMKPFEDALKSLDFLESWEYRNAKKKPLTKAQRDRFTYSTFKNCYISFRLKNPPDLSGAIQKKADEAAERKAKAEARKAKRNDPVTSM